MRGLITHLTFSLLSVARAGLLILMPVAGLASLLFALPVPSAPRPPGE